MKLHVKPGPISEVTNANIAQRELLQARQSCLVTTALIPAPILKELYYFSKNWDFCLHTNAHMKAREKSEEKETIKMVTVVYYLGN